MPQAPGPLGFITPADRNPAQHAAHAAAEAMMPRFALAPPVTAGPVKVVLSDFWHAPEVVADTGIDFDRAPFHQLTGSCVGAGGGNALYTLICVQRMLNEGATKAFVPWWPFNYGRSRLFMGEHGRGEGSMGSTFAKSVREDGVTSAAEAGLPGFQKRDGYELTSGQEMEWSDGDSRPVIDYLDEAKPHPLGSATPLRSPQDIKAAVLNGYPGTIACNNYIGNASVQGSGDKARVIGHWNGRGGHQQWFFGYEDHPDFGPLYAVGNNWPRGTYPKDPGGLPLVCCWVLEKKVEEMFRLDAEVYLFSHLPWAPAQPKVLDFSSI
jgi:hypothetical protein